MNGSTGMSTPIPISAKVQRAAQLISWPLAVIIVLLFSQVWRDIAGFTFRLIDLVLLLFLTFQLSAALYSQRLRYFRSAVNAPLLLWSAVILLGAFVAQIRPLIPLDQRDAIINGVRLVLALALFFMVNNDRSVTTTVKAQTVFYTVIGFSLVTTFVSLLQIAHWAGQLPFNLPAVLVTFKPGANQDPGREIFALFVGNNGTHTWSAMLAFQALTVWVVAITTKSMWRRLSGMSYFLLLSAILIRTSVRNSILGLFVAVILLSLMRALRSRYAVNRLVVPAFILAGILVVVTSLLAVGSELYFVERVAQAIPRLTPEGIVVDRASNIFGRLDYIAAGLNMFSRYPLLGSGFYGFRTFYLELTRDATISHAHNSYIQVLAELGLVGMIAFGWLVWRIFGILATAGSRIAHQRIWERRSWNLAVSVFIFILFTAIFANPIWEPTAMGFFMILVALVNRYYWERQ